MQRAVMRKANDSFGWVLDVSEKAKRSVWDRITGKDDDDNDDGPGGNAGATLWPVLFGSKRAGSVLSPS